MKCEHCPVDDGRECLGSRHRPLCVEVAGGATRRADQLRRFAGLPGLIAPPPARRAPAPGGRPRVGLLAPCLAQGGAESWQLALVASTRDRLDWRGVAVASPERAGFDGGYAPGVDPAMLARTRALLPVECGRDAIRHLAARCDVLVSWLLEDLEPHLAGIEPRPKVIYCDHFPHDAVYDRATRWCLRSVDRVVGVSELCAPGFPPEFAGRTSIIWNALDPAKLARSRSRAEVRASWGVPAGAKVAGFYGRLAREKRPDAMARLAAAMPGGWHAVLVGAGSDRPAPGPRLHVLPPDPAAADVLGAFDVLVVPSEFESFGLTLAEGVALEVPVVATRSGLAKIRPGLVVPVGLDAPGAELAAAVLRADAEGPRPGAAAYVRRRAGLARFGRAWAALVGRLAGDDLAVWAEVEACEHGQSGPCGCDGRPRACTRSGSVELVDRATRCFECKKAELTR